MTSCQEKTYRESPQTYLIVTEGIWKEPRGISSRHWPLWYTWIGYRQVNGPPWALPSKSVDHRSLCADIVVS